MTPGQGTDPGSQHRAEVCPFSYVKSNKVTGNFVALLGSSTYSWTGALEVTMTRGDWCGAISDYRKAIIDFTCSDRTEIYGIAENEVCVYEFSFGSKYACGTMDSYRDRCIPTSRTLNERMSRLTPVFAKSNVTVSTK